MKRLIAGFLGFSLIIPSLASAQTIDELRAQINSLLAIVAQLQTQLQTQTGNSNDSFCYTFNNDLGVGNRGVEVARLHTALQKSGFSIPDAETPGKDGETINDTRFGEITASKVSEFQEKYRSEILTPAGLSSPTGYVGGRTRAKLNQLYRCNQTPTPLPTNPTPTLPVACTMDAMLCPDGKTYVGRTGPKCEFAACPVTTEKPDITIASAFCGPLNPKINEPIACSITIYNNSPVTVYKSFDINFNGSTITVGAPMFAYEKRIISSPAQFSFFVAGKHTINIPVDIWNTVDESDENNNMVSLNLEVVN